MNSKLCYGGARGGGKQPRTSGLASDARPPAPLAHLPRRQASHVRRRHILWFAVGLGVRSVTLSTLAVAVASESAAACVGDCNNSGAVTIEELVNGVNIA